MVMLNFLQAAFSGIHSDLLVIFEIGIIIILATILAFIVKLARQPLIPAYIITGILIGPLVFGIIQDQSLIIALSEIGVAFLIFTAGLEIKFKKLGEVGKTVIIAGILQIFFLFILTYLISSGLGFSNQSLFYIGLVVAFSSTMIVVKVLNDKREIDSLHGRIIIGILLIQDIAAIIALTVISSDLSVANISLFITKAGIFAIAAFMLSKISSPIFKASAEDSDMLLLCAISFLFIFVLGSYAAGLSLIVGAFFAGVSLANSEYKTEIQGRIGPLREFFSVIFFVSLGMQLRLITKEFVLLFFVLFFLVIIIKPIITMFIIRLLGYKKSTSFLTGNALAQTSEFSLIIATLGFNLGYINEGLFSTLILLTIATMSMTIYLIRHEKALTKWLDWPLNLLNNFHTKNESLEYHEIDGKKIIIFGCHRMGSLFVKEFNKNKKGIFVVDYNPEIIKYLIEKKVPCMYGDFANEEVFNKAEIKKAEIIISTIPDMDDNVMLVKKVRRLNKEALIFIVAERISEALKLYKIGVDYVILPQVIGGQKVSELIPRLRDKDDVKILKKEHMEYLDSIHNILY